MITKRIFMTGASGCIGHYIVDALIQETNHELYLLVRNPEQLRFDTQARPGIHILQADLMNVSQFSKLLPAMDIAILAAASWGGQQVYDINVFKTLQLVKMLDPKVCEQVIYFSTASILDRSNQLLKEAGQLGNDYTRAKYDCHRQLAKLEGVPPISVLYPTLVFGGSDRKPYSHISAGMPEALKWISLARFFRADASFHFIHGRDIAQVVSYLVEHPPASTLAPDCAFSHQWVLGNQRVTVDQALEEICDYLNKKIYFRIPLSVGLAEALIPILRLVGIRIELSAWDWFCVRYRHFTHQEVVNPSVFNQPTHCSTIKELLKVSGIPQPLEADSLSRKKSLDPTE